MNSGAETDVFTIVSAPEFDDYEGLLHFYFGMKSDGFFLFLCSVKSFVMKYDIFISYRRKDSSGRSNVPTARQFKLAFEAPPYNYKVFFDYSECTDNYFSDTILPAIRTCDFFVLVLTKDCLARCVNEGDWVRREIEEAIAYNKKIIPITPDRECETFPSDLPDSLRKTFKDLQITTVYTDHMFESSIDYLVKHRFHLNKVLTDSETERKAKEAAERERQEKERLAKEEAKRKAERERQEQERLARERAEAERKAKEEAERERLEREQKTKQANGHEYVDLGLPSGTLWATCNVGASKPEDYGDYFAWGEIQPKAQYDWDTYKYSKTKKRLFNDDKVLLTKYCGKAEYGYDGFTDRLTKLQPSDDPSSANWGNGWYTPQKEQWGELMANTNSEWTTRNGVEGRLFTSKKNGQSLFLPAAGYRWDDELSYAAGIYGYYWSSSLDTDYPYYAWYFYFGSGGTYMDSDRRGDGRSVRAVRSSAQN